MDDPTRARALVAGQFLALAALAIPDRPNSGKRRGPSEQSSSRRGSSRRGAPGRGAPGPRTGRRAAGWSLILAGGALSGAAASALGPNLRPLPLPRLGVTLRTAGPYSLTRHPIYAGILLAAVGRTLATGGRRHAVATLALGAIFRTKARFEEQLLAGVVDYRPYQAAVPRWGLRRSIPKN